MFCKSNMKLFWIFSRFSFPEKEPEAKSSCHHKQQTLWLLMGLTAESKQHRFVQRYVTERSIKQESLSKNSWHNTSNFTQLVPHSAFQRTEQIQGKIRASSINKRKSPAEKYLEIVDAKASKKLFPPLSSCNSWKPIKCPFVLSIYQWVFRLHLEHKIQKAWVPVSACYLVLLRNKSNQALITLVSLPLSPYWRILLAEFKNILWRNLLHRYWNVPPTPVISQHKILFLSDTGFTCICRRTTSRGYVTVWLKTPAAAPHVSFPTIDGSESPGK